MSVSLDIERIGETNFAKPIHRAMLRDVRLSWGARGLFAFLWDLPSGWRPCIAHLVHMGSQGTHAVTALRNELAAVGALEIVTVRHNSKTAADATAGAAVLGTNKVFRQGQVVGTKWRLYSPVLWAIESPLGWHQLEGTSTELQETRNSVVASLQESPTKVHQVKGSPNVRHHRIAGNGNCSGEMPQDWMDAIALEVDLESKQREIKNLPGLRRSILSRYEREGGPGSDVLDLLAKRREATIRATELQLAKDDADRHVVEVARTGPGLPDSSALGRQVTRLRAMHKRQPTRPDPSGDP